jgi:hypothetical protein
MRRLTSGGHGYPDLREPCLHIFGNFGVDGIRLTDLAARAQLSLATASELVSDLQALRYLERRAEGTDKRARLIFPTPHGRQAVDDAGDRVAQIEEHGRRSSDRSALPTPAAPCKTCWTLSPPATTRRDLTQRADRMPTCG